MQIPDALHLAEKILRTGERVELLPSKDGADVYIIKRRKAQLNMEPRPERGTGGAERG